MNLVNPNKTLTVSKKAGHYNKQTKQQEVDGEKKPILMNYL
jgi:hypothetical protein